MITNRATEIDTIAECFDAQMYPWSNFGELAFCVDGGTQTMLVMGGFAFFWLCGVILGAAIGR